MTKDEERLKELGDRIAKATVTVQTNQQLIAMTYDEAKELSELIDRVLQNTFVRI